MTRWCAMFRMTEGWTEGGGGVARAGRVGRKSLFL